MADLLRDGSPAPDGVDTPQTGETPGALQRGKPEDHGVYMPTWDVELDRLLAPDHLPGGLRVGRGVNGALEETPVLVIQGCAGTGKTVLALGIAAAAAGFSAPNGEWTALYLSLEEPSMSLDRVASNFGFDPEQEAAETESAKFLDLDKIAPVEGSDPKPPSGNGANGNGIAAWARGKVLLSRLSPLPRSEANRDSVFETRFAELEHMLQNWEKPNGPLLCVLDSLSAFTGTPLNRAQLHQLFNLFQSRKIPLVATLERSRTALLGETVPVDTAAFLADIVIELSRSEQSEYFLTFLEITKSRVCRQALGKHLYKIRTAPPKKRPGEPKDGLAADDARTGMTVYPSVDFLISQAWKLHHDGAVQDRNPPPFQVNPDLAILFQDQTKDKKEDPKEPFPVALPACFALQGPPGTHKLALGLNLAVSAAPEGARLLVINFGSQGDIDFKHVAWTGSHSYLNKLEPRQWDRGTKFNIKRYTASAGPSEQQQTAAISVLTLQIGALTPEEFLHRVDRMLKQANPPFQSVLVSDTAELATGFPLLSRRPMFFATLLDIFEAERLLVVAIGVQSSDNPVLQELNLALTAKATHRMRLFQFPTVEELMSRRVEEENGTSSTGTKQKENGMPSGTAVAEKRKKNLPQQLVTVVIDNVTGKNYSREPKWISIPEINEKRTLICEDFDDRTPDKREDRPHVLTAQ